MIYFQSVTKTFGSYTVLDELDLHIEKGKITFIIGKSGEGKSVTVKHIMGLMRPTSGRIIVNGQDITDLTDQELRSYRRQFGMLFQHGALFDSMTVLENVIFPLAEHSMLPKNEILRRVYDILEQTGLSDLAEHFPSELATGEKKRVGLARALVTKPKILLYDEPTTGMDPLVCEMIDQLIVKTNQREKAMTSVVISHDLKAAMATADKIIMLYKGRVALAGSPKDFQNSHDPIVRQFFSGRIEGPMEFL